jgi:hypothetical protein
MEYPILIIGALLMLAAPFVPMPHVVEKLIMLKNGQLTRPLDIFDLFFHLIPTILLAIKIVRNLQQNAGG